MFTGIITDVGRIKVLEKTGDLRAVIETQYRTDLIADGASICCSGVCLTLVDKGHNWFAVDVSKETTDTTTIGRWGVGTSVNLERSLQLGDELGGHIVSGHVDGVVKLQSIEKEGASHRVSLELPLNLAKFIASKGSVTLDGISLTVNQVSDNSFGANIIHHTWENTSFKSLRIGSILNIEVDVIARYVARLMNSKESK
jgi:riboflavin synthase